MYFKTLIIALALSLLPADMLYATQEIQQIESADPTRKSKMWYKKTANWLLITGTACATILAGTIARKEWKKYQLKQQLLLPRKRFINEILNQPSIDGLNTLIKRNQTLYNSDLLIIIIGTSKGLELTVASDMSTRDKESIVGPLQAAMRPDRKSV